MEPPELSVAVADGRRATKKGGARRPALVAIGQVGQTAWRISVKRAMVASAL
jgi:hypothetical protein